MIAAKSFLPLLSNRQIPHSTRKSPRSRQRDQQPPQIITPPDRLIILGHKGHLGFRLPVPGDIHGRTCLGRHINQCQHFWRGDQEGQCERADQR